MRQLFLSAQIYIFSSVLLSSLQIQYFVILSLIRFHAVSQEQSMGKESDEYFRQLFKSLHTLTAQKSKYMQCHSLTKIDPALSLIFSHVFHLTYVEKNRCQLEKYNSYKDKGLAHTAIMQYISTKYFLYAYSNLRLKLTWIHPIMHACIVKALR